MSVIRVRPEAIGISKAEEARGVSGVQLTKAVGKDGENAGEAADLGGLSCGDSGGEAVNGAVVSVEDLIGGRGE